jgi:hypothetical protein
MLAAERITKIINGFFVNVSARICSRSHLPKKWKNAVLFVLNHWSGWHMGHVATVKSALLAPQGCGSSLMTKIVAFVNKNALVLW